MEQPLLYEPPFTDIAPTGPDQVFDEGRVTRGRSPTEGSDRSWCRFPLNRALREG